MEIKVVELQEMKTILESIIDFKNGKKKPKGGKY